MQLSVLQQKPRFSYDPEREAPALPFLREQAARTLDDTFEMLGEAARRGSRLAVTVECVNAHMSCTDLRRPFAEAYEGLDGAVVERFSKCARREGMHIVAGLYLTVDGRTYNCAVLFDAAGKIVGIHRKVHLPAGEELQITPGDRFEVFETELGPVGMLVCWDMQFPEAARTLALKGANLIACPTWGWENLYGLCRAYENSVTIAAAMGVNASGLTSADCDPSCVVDNMGRIVAAAPRDASAVVTCAVDLLREPAPQYGSERYIDSASMRRTRLLQRRPETYGLLTVPTAETPCYRRYFPPGGGEGGV